MNTNQQDTSSSNETATTTATNEDVKETNTTVILEGPLNGKVYVVGTAHFSLKSNEEVKQLIKNVKPDYVMLELCNSRAGMLTLDEETVMRESKDLSAQKIRQIIRSSSPIQGVLHVLLVRLYAKFAEQLGMIPGGEFRAANQEASQIPGCRVVLGDRPVDITLKRGFGALPWYRKLYFAYMLLTTDFNVTKEDIEKLKDKDMLEQLLEEFGGKFPEFKRVLVDEHDIYLAHQLKTLSQPIPNEFVQSGFSPVTVVGVVGLGHVQGIVKNWDKRLDVSQLSKLPEPSNVGKYIKIGLFAGFILFSIVKVRSKVL